MKRWSLHPAVCSLGKHLLQKGRKCRPRVSTHMYERAKEIIVHMNCPPTHEHLWLQTSLSPSMIESHAKCSSKPTSVKMPNSTNTVYCGFWGHKCFPILRYWHSRVFSFQSKRKQLAVYVSEKATQRAKTNAQLKTTVFGLAYGSSICRGALIGWLLRCHVQRCRWPLVLFFWRLVFCAFGVLVAGHLHPLCNAFSLVWCFSYKAHRVQLIWRSTPSYALLTLLTWATCAQIAAVGKKMGELTWSRCDPWQLSLWPSWHDLHCISVLLEVLCLCLVSLFLGVVSVVACCLALLVWFLCLLFGFSFGFCLLFAADHTLFHPPFTVQRFLRLPRCMRSPRLCRCRLNVPRPLRAEQKKAIFRLRRLLRCYSKAQMWATRAQTTAGCGQKRTILNAFASFGKLRSTPDLTRPPPVQVSNSHLLSWLDRDLVLAFRSSVLAQVHTQMQLSW